MSTRSYICRENENGSFTGIYCHHDGYLTYNGALLLDHYNTPERVDKLISLGDISTLNEKIDPDPHFEHNFDNRQEDVSVFYGRDRGEKDTEARLVDLEEIDKPDSWIEYCYIFGKDGNWKYFECGNLKDGIKDLSEGLKEEYKNLGFPRPEGYYGFFSQQDIKMYQEKAKEAESQM